MGGGEYSKVLPFHNKTFFNELGQFEELNTSHKQSMDKVGGGGGQGLDGLCMKLRDKPKLS